MITAGDTGTSSGLDEGSFLPDLTTLLDILFILLVFFILTAGAVYQSIDLTLPKSASEDAPRPAKADHLLLELRSETYAVNGEEISTLDELKSLIPTVLKNNPDKQLVIAGDRTVSLERVLNVLTFLQSQGIEAANILMQKETPK